MAGVHGRARVHINPGVIARAKQLMQQRASAAEPHRVTIGIHEAEGSQPKLGYDGKDSGATLAQVAAAHEFGAGVPTRSWLRTWFDQNRAQLTHDMAATMKRAYLGDADAFERQGEAWAASLRDWIEYHDGGLKALAATTLEAKERAGLPSPETPLFATGQLVAAVKAMLDEG